MNGQPLEPLAAVAKQPYRVLFAGRVPRADEYADSPLVVERLRELGAGILEEVTVRNFSSETVECLVAFSVESDFADLFEVKEARIQRHWDETRQPEGDSLIINAVWKGVRKTVVIKARGADVAPDALTYRAVIPPHGHWSRQLSLVPALHGTGPAPPFVHPAPGEMSPGTDGGKSGWRTFPCCR